MSIKTTCPVTGKVLLAPDRLAGKAVRCPACSGMHRVPMPGEEDPFVEV